MQSSGMCSASPILWLGVSVHPSENFNSTVIILTFHLQNQINYCLLGCWFSHLHHFWNHDTTIYVL